MQNQRIENFMSHVLVVVDPQQSLAHASALMRGHGMTVVADSIPAVVFRAIYTEMIARLQIQATQLDGPIETVRELLG